MAGETILVVDDAVFILKLMATVLRKEGYKVHLASSAEEGLSILRTLRPNLIFADIYLPGIDGLDLIRQIRTDVRLRESTVIAMTASSRPGIETEAIDDGGSEKGGHSGSVGTESPRRRPGGAFLSCQEGLFGTARSGQGRAAVGRGEANP